MELKQLVYFLQICEDGSFSTAADRLFITQQGLSMSISRLEKELGCLLFLRNTRNLQLTEDGIYLREKARQIVALSDECKEHFDKLYKQPQMINIISGIDFLGILPLNIQHIIQNRNPDFPVNLQLASGIQGETLLDQGVCNIGFICGPINENKYHAHLLMTRDYYYIMNANHSLAKFDSLRFEQFRDQQLILPGPETKIYHEFMQQCTVLGFKPNVIFHSDRQTLIHNMVKSDPLCMGQVLDYFVENINDPKVKGLPVSDCDMSWKLYLIWRRNHTLSKKEKAFVKLVLNSLSAEECE